MSFSRGAWTDEGMYTSQIKNAIINDEVDVKESPCFVISPLFSALNYFPYKFFGWSSRVSRLIVLLGCLLIVSFLFFKYNEIKKLILFLIPLLFFEEHIFHFMHYSLAEMLAIFSIFIGCYFLYRSLVNQQNKNILYSILFFTCSYMFKIQYVYGILIIPVFLFLWFVFQYRLKKQSRSSLKKIAFKFAVSISVSIGFYLALWYFPNKDMIDHVLGHMAESRTIDTEELNAFGVGIDYLLNLKNFFTSSIQSSPLVMMFLLFSVVGFFFLFAVKSSKFFQINFLIAFSWVLLEMHKFSMNYLPTRYLLSVYFSMGLLIVIVICEAIRRFKKGEKKYKLALGFFFFCLVVLIGNNFRELKRSYDTRTFDILLANEYFSQYQFNDRPIMGTWASSLARDAEVVTLPFFENYINHQNILKQFHPKVIIFEEIEENVLINDKINIIAIADSIVEKKIGKYDLKIVWIK